MRFFENQRERKAQNCSGEKSSGIFSFSLARPSLFHSHLRKMTICEEFAFSKDYFFAAEK
jgi:hypothetical protein